MVGVGPGGEPSEQWREEMGRLLVAHVLPQLEPLVAQLNRTLAPSLELFARNVEETTRPWVAGLARIAERLTTTVLTPEFLILLARVSEQRPVNWPTSVDLKAVIAVVTEDGIPLVWVPRAELVEQVLDAPDWSRRLDVLVAHEDLVVEDCRRVLEDITSPSLVDRLPLARAAVEAFSCGHREAAQSLATIVIEAAVTAAVSDSYDRVQRQVRREVKTMTWFRMRLTLALAPVLRFYTPWSPRSGKPAPAALSRHATVHHAGADHFTPGNALVAIMLVTSVLRAIEELEDLDHAAPDPAG